jgi:hypothetical protein
MPTAIRTAATTRTAELPFFEEARAVLGPNLPGVLLDRAGQVGVQSTVGARLAKS